MIDSQIKSNNLAPIILFVYNRPEHTRKTVESLTLNKLAPKSDLFIFSDGAKNEIDIVKVKLVREYVRGIKGFNKVEIIERDKNLGLADSVISGVSEILKIHNRVIVLEDDMISSPFFLKFMNDLLQLFEEDNRIQSVTGYTFPIKIPKNYQFPIYLASRSSSWGWGTWKSRWLGVDWELKDFPNFINDISKVESFNQGGDDLTRMLSNSMRGKVDSWSIRWTYSHFVRNTYCVYPVKSRIKNIGTDKSGVHTGKTNKFNVDLGLNDVDLSRIQNLQPDHELLKNFRKFFKKNILSSILEKIRN